MHDLIEHDGTLRFLNRAMDILSFRHTLLASNIANVDTPGYHAVDLDFQQALDSALQRSEAQPFMTLVSGNPFAGSSPSLRVMEVEGKTDRIDGNTVDIDRELLKLDRTTALYSQATRFMAMKMRMLKMAIREEA